MITYQMLDEPLISVAVSGTSAVERLTLPALYSALARDRVTDFSALRPHQRHVLHAFLVQVAALALHRADAREFPDGDKRWRELLLGLTPDGGDGAAWALVAPHNRPALLQPPIADGDVTGFKRINTPLDGGFPDSTYGSPPRTRGCTRVADSTAERHDVSPAYAGMHPRQANSRSSV